MHIKKLANDQRMEILKSLGSWFAGLSQEELQSLAGICEKRIFASGEVLFFQEDPAHGFYIVIDGNITVFRLNPEGREHILQIMERGDFAGEVPVFMKREYPASARAEDRTETFYINADSFLKMGKKNPDILLGMLKILALRMTRFVQMIDDLALKEVSARLARYLLQKSIREESSSFRLNISKAVLASRLGTIPETLSRTLSKMKRKGYIKVKGSVIKIEDQGSLEILSTGRKL